jgi:hypothetical protein
MAMNSFSLPSRRALLLMVVCWSTTGCFDPEPEEHKADADAAEPDEPDAGDPAQMDEPDAETPDEPESDPSCRTPDVDLLFVIDDSGSMAEEQKKLARALPQLLYILGSGNHSGKRSLAGEATDFAPAQTMHVGVVTTDLGVNEAPPIESCGAASYEPTAPDPANTKAEVRALAPNGVRLDKPFGDDGTMQTSTEVALAGIWSRPSGSTFADPVALVVDPDPSCESVQPSKPYLEYGPGDLFEDTAHDFSCIAKLGKNGCGLEQQLEAMYKALAPASERFSRSSGGQGSAGGTNAGFLREDAILVVVVISDEDDCSIPDDSSELFNRNSSVFNDDINVRCGKPENQHLLEPVSRYVEGLRALKPARYRDRIVFASATGAPLADPHGDDAVVSGHDALTRLLARPEMQFVPRLISGSATLEEPTPVCASPSGDGSAAPGRRFVQVAQAFDDNGLLISICEDDYQPLVAALSERIARHLGSCDE